DQERSRFADTEEAVVVPDFMSEIVGEFTALARKSADINQRSGVSVRVSIANYETLAACALRRAIRYNESQAVPRVSDLPFIIASTLGKLELETVEDGREGRVVDELTKKAVLNVFNRHFDTDDFIELQIRFEEGLEVETGSEVPSFAYSERLGAEGGLAPMLQRFGIDPAKQEALFASGAEFVLDGLHLNRKLNRDRVEGRHRYRS
ncbi:MAG: magnesium chelatase, partial [Chloroflexota bacterium]|nr:magnesium chelatase [Chloroflexota bacterium]